MVGIAMVYLKILFSLNLLVLNESTPVITLKGLVHIHMNSNEYQVECSTNFSFWGCTIEFLINGRTHEDLQLSNKSCYYSLGICNPNICTCSDACNEFKWNLTAEVLTENTLIACEGRIEVNDKYYKAHASILLTRSGFLNSKSKVTLLNNGMNPLEKIPTTTVHSMTQKSDNDSSVLVIIVFILAVIMMCIIILTIGWFYRHFYKPKGDCDLCQNARECSENEGYSTESDSRRTGTVEENKQKFSNTYIVENHIPRKVKKSKHTIIDAIELQTQPTSKVTKHIEQKISDLVDIQSARKVTEHKHDITPPVCAYDLDDSESQHKRDVTTNQLNISFKKKNSDSGNFKSQPKRKIPNESNISDAGIKQIKPEKDVTIHKQKKSDVSEFDRPPTAARGNDNTDETHSESRKKGRRRHRKRRRKHSVNDSRQPSLQDTTSTANSGSSLIPIQLAE